VRLADLIQVRPQTTDHLAWRNRILCKHIDFVLCDHDSMEIRLAVELDDRTHQRPKRQERDAFVDSALEAAGIPLLRVKAAGSYDVEHIRQAVEERISAP
jgi:very-short-patch-repair endonuclease